MAGAMQNIMELWRRIGLAQRALLMGLLLTIVIASVLLVGWMTKPKMTLLYGGLEPDEAGKIADKLRDQGVAYEMQAGGTTIMVQEDKVADLRMSLASQGMPSGGDSGGYRILDDEKIGASPFAQRVNYVRAIEGELVRTIKTLDGVNSARVHVVRPEGALFAGKDKDASATIVIGMKGSRRLGANQVAAVIHAVSGAVESLRPERVVVVDTQGNLLSGEESNPVAGKANSFHDYKTRVEQDLGSKVEDMLTTAGLRSSVRVSVKMRTTAVTTSKETYDPAGKVVASETMKTKSSAEPAEAGKTGGTTKEETSDAKYLVGKTVESTEQIPGEVTSRSVAVVVDLTPRKDAEGKEIAAMTQTQVEGLVKSALGLKTKAENGEDELSVVTAAFPAIADAGTGAPEGMFNKDFIMDIAKHASLGLIVIGLLLMMKIFGGKKKAKGETVAAMATGGSAGSLTGQTGQNGNLLPSPENDADRNMLKSRITRALEDNPEEVKRLFLSWAQTEQTV